MDPKAIETDIKNYKIREGTLYKRSKFLKEWRERWIVLTTNFLYTFTNKNLDQMTDAVDLKQIKSYKSYVRKDQEMIPPGFKIRSADDMMYFCAKNCNQKWSWLVTLERLMDYKYVGTSNYNNADWIRTKGFDSQIDFEAANGKKPETKPENKTGSPTIQKKSSETTTATDTKPAPKQANQQYQKNLKKLQQLQKQLDKKKFQYELRQATIVTQQKKIQQQWVRIQEAKRQLIALQNQQKNRAHQQIKSPSKNEVQQVKQPQKKQEIKQQEKNTKVVEADSPQRASFAQLKNMFEKKPESSSTVPPIKPLPPQRRDKKQEDSRIHRSKVITLLFQQYKQKVAISNAIKYTTDFIINVGGDKNSGFSSIVSVEGRVSPYNKNFAEVVTEFLCEWQNYENAQNLMKFLQICFSQMYQIFTQQQIARAQKKLVQFLDKVKNEQILTIVLRNMSILNKNHKYSKPEVAGKLENIMKSVKNEQTKTVARKLHDDL